ncbi:MAG: LicD family protein [Nitriliruptoraceae bacterium]|nr:LicD family protein [Nitriliruptoraceae bacterium]
MTEHPLLRPFQDVANILRRNDIHFVLSGGTMLGAVRDGQIIPHDKDIDFELFADDRERVLELRAQFEACGIELKEKYRRGLRLDDGSKVDEPVCFANNIHLRHDGVHIGDLLLFTVFDDGIARRYHEPSGTLYNPRTMIPAWFLEETVEAPIAGEMYPVVRDPEVVLETIYGPGWVRPIAPGAFARGQNTGSGAVFDKKTERLIEHALANGWDGDYTDRPRWPTEVVHINSQAGRRWVFRHEPELVRGAENLLSDVRSKAIYGETSPFRRHHALRLLVLESMQAGSSAAKRLAKEELEPLEVELARTREERDRARRQRDLAHAKLRAWRRRPVRTGLAYARRKLAERRRRSTAS